MASPPRDAEEFQAYLNTIACFDVLLRRLFRLLGERGFLDNTVVFVVGDHGEAFGEHGRRQHDDVLWEEGVHVPLILQGPHSLVGPPRRAPGLRQLTDLAATVAHLVGVPQDREARSPAWGMSLLETPPPDRKIFLSSYLPGAGLAMVQGRVKTIYEPRFDILRRFDLERDPLEKNDLGGGIQSKLRRAFIDEMLAFRDGVNAWYRACDRNEAAGVRRTEVPDVNERLDLRFGPALLLVGVSGTPREKLDRYLNVALVFEVLAEPNRDLELVLRTRQYGKVRKAACVRDPNRVPIRTWRKGDVLVIPNKIHLDRTLVQPGDVSLELAIVSRGSERPEKISFDKPGRPRVVRSGGVEIMRVHVQPYR